MMKSVLRSIVVACLGTVVVAVVSAAEPAIKQGKSEASANTTNKKTCPRCGKVDCEYMVGINLAGAEFAPRTLPGVEGRNYGWPTANRLDYWKSRGVRLIRLPFSWERLQPELMKDFDPKYLEGLTRSVKLMQERDMLVILDLHNYARFRGKPLGSTEVPLEAFGDVWGRLAERFKGNPAVYGYGLMNEPGKCDWAKAAQTAIDSIRKVDKTTRIYVANDYPGWAASHAKGDLVTWAESQLRIGDPKMLKDPSNLLRWELHMYMDHDASGTYRKTYAAEVARKDGPGTRVGPNLGVQRVKPFVKWLKKHNEKGLIGEYSVPANPDKDERWMVCLDNAVAYFEKNCLSSTYWAGGEYWSRGNGYLIGPNGWKLNATDTDKDRPQWKILKKYMRKISKVTKE